MDTKDPTKPMADNKEKPHLSIAALCESALIEKDDVLSGIRFIDRVTIGTGSEVSLQDISSLALSVWAIISFKSGPARGDRVLELVANTPSGRRRELIPSHTVNFKGEDTGASIRVQVHLVGIEVGLYWIDVLLDGETYTRMPLRIIHKPEDGGREP
jgi:hypothetical protein